MKTMTKKLGAIVLALALCLSLCCSALAAETQTVAASPQTMGTIQIDGAVAGETYTIYQLFDLTYADDYSAYSYKVNSAWQTFIETYTYTDHGSIYNLFEIDTNGYLKVDSHIFDDGLDSSVIADFAQAALSYAETSGITGTGISFSYNSATGTATPTNCTIVADSVETVNGVTTASLKSNSLSLGYYLVGTSLGSLCMLDSTNPDAEISEKNPTPYPEKEVKDSETDDEYGKKDTAEVGDTLSYEVFIRDCAHSVKLCMHDVMSEGLTFTTGSVHVYYGYPDSTITDLFNDDTTVWTEVLADSTTWTESDSCGDGCDFELSFNDSWVNGLTDGAVIRVTYEAVVNENAVTESLWDTEHNTVHLTYGANGTSVNSETETDTVGFNLYKYAGTDKDTPLDGAEFSLYRDAAHTNSVSFIEVYDQDGNLVGYEEVDPSTYTGSATPTTTIKAGSVYVKGLHEGTYYLVETKAPDGYNMLVSDVVITISATWNADGTTVTSESVSYTYNGTTVSDTGTTVYVQNNIGTELPTTGGIGTTIFYIIGGVLVAGAVVVLVTRRRMTREG